MNFLPLLLGAFAMKSMTGYPAEISNLTKQIPSSERDAVLQHYKSLPGQAKNDFKKALREADLTAASQILGEDLSRFNITLDPKAVKETAGSTEFKPTSGKDPEREAAGPEYNSDIVARVNKILAVPTSIDPQLVAEAAKRYEEAVPARSAMSIDEKTKKLLEVSG